jgi:glycosyltransferase involved in cell wall biosynthesis
MRIVVHDYAGHPFQVQLSRELARRGHDVWHLYYGYNNTPKGNLRNDGSSSSGSLVIDALYTKEPVQKYSYLKRWLQDVEYGRVLAEKVIEIQPDVVITANTPLDSLHRAMPVCHAQNARFIFWLQDFSGIAAHKLLKQNIPLLGDLIGQYHISLEKKLLQESDGVVLISEDFAPIMRDWGVQVPKTTVIPNWAPLEEVPARTKNNPWAVEHGLGGKFCFMYTGGLGLKHDPNMLLHLTIAFRGMDDVCVVVVSEGLGEKWLREKKAEMGLENLVLLGYQPFEQIPDILATGDVLVAILKPEASKVSVPSKVLTYLCARRPILLAVPEDNVASRIILQHQAGFVASPGDIDQFISGARILYHDPVLRQRAGENARSYAEMNFDITKITTQFEELFSRIL